MFEGNTFKIIHWVATFLTSLGALNWGSVGLLDSNFVHALLGAWPMVEKIVYGLIGASGLWTGFSLFGGDKYCKNN